MTLDDIRRRIDAALPVRVPQFDPNTHPAEKVSKLETYLLTTAFHRGELVEAWHWLEEVRKRALSEWNDIQGFEVALPGSRRNVTQGDVKAAKRTMRPDLARLLEDCTTLERDLERQIRRLEWDDRAASRSYTLITGS